MPDPEGADAYDLKSVLDACKHADQQEINLLSMRLNAFLTSQGLLVAAAGVVYTTSAQVAPHRRALLIAICLLGLALSIFTVVAIGLGCWMIRRWFRHGNEAKDKHPAEWNKLKGLTLNRRLPDWTHRFSLDMFAYGMTLSFLIFWVASLLALHYFAVALDSPA